MGAYQISCAALLFGFSIASPLGRRQFNNEGYNGAGINDPGSWSNWTPGKDDGSWSNTDIPTPTPYSWPASYAWTAGTNFTTLPPLPTTTAFDSPTSTTSMTTTTSAPFPTTTAADTSMLSSTTITPPFPTTTAFDNSTSTSTTTPAPTPTLSPCTNTTMTNCTSAGANGTDTYTFYQGDGSQAAGWPSMDQWESFDNMWANNQALIANSCVNLGTPPNNDDSETATVRTSILSLASSTGVDARFILAVMIQESKGCVRVITTFGSHANPGLMQDNNGNHTCNVGGVLLTPCPDDQIYGMLSDGVAGTASGDGLLQLLADPSAAAIDGEMSSNCYKAARMYNSGSIDPSGDLGAGGSTHCYASDIANRVMGWVFAPSTCTL